MRQFWMTCCSVLLFTGCSGLHQPMSAYTGAVTFGVNQTQEAFELQAVNYDAQQTGKDSVIYFALNKSDIPANAKKLLSAQADYLIEHPDATLILQGHTDERGSREYNVALGWRRAHVVATFLENAGVPRQQIREVSYGQEKPVSWDHNEAAWAKNRRCEMIFEYR